jgi:hypothetical protein
MQYFSYTISPVITKTANSFEILYNPNDDGTSGKSKERHI